MYYIALNIYPLDLVRRLLPITNFFSLWCKFNQYRIAKYQCRVVSVLWNAAD